MLSDKDSLNHPENEKDADKLACSCSKQMKVEIYLKFHQSPKVVKILAELLKKYRNPTNIKPWRSWHKLIFHARMNNAAAVIVTKDADVFLLLIHACIIVRNVFSYHGIQWLVLPQLHAINVRGTTSYKFNGPCFVKVCKDTSSLSLLKIIGLTIDLFEEIVEKAKIFI